MTRAGRIRRSDPSASRALDGMRALAAYGVLATHAGFNTGRSLDSGPFAPLLARLDFGVTVFFLLSGFLLYRPFAASAMAGTRGAGRAPVLPAAGVADPARVLAGGAGDAELAVQAQRRPRRLRQLPAADPDLQPPQRRPEPDPDVDAGGRDLVLRGAAAAGAGRARSRVAAPSPPSAGNWRCCSAWSPSRSAATCPPTTARYHRPGRPDLAAGQPGLVRRRHGAGAAVLPARERSHRTDRLGRGPGRPARARTGHRARHLLGDRRPAVLDGIAAAGRSAQPAGAHRLGMDDQALALRAGGAGAAASADPGFRRADRQAAGQRARCGCSGSCPMASTCGICRCCWPSSAGSASTPSAVTSPSCSCSPALAATAVAALSWFGMERPLLRLGSSGFRGGAATSSPPRPPAAPATHPS